jgi:hypothetical protein
MNYVLIATGVLASGAALVSIKTPPGPARDAYHMGLSIGGAIGVTAVLSMFVNL